MDKNKNQASQGLELAKNLNNTEKMQPIVAEQDQINRYNASYVPPAPVEMATYNVLSTLIHDGQVKQAGDTVTIPVADAQRLIDMQVIEVIA